MRLLLGMCLQSSVDKQMQRQAQQQYIQRGHGGQHLSSTSYHSARNSLNGLQNSKAEES
jgi:hypothetical protein